MGDHFVSWKDYVETLHPRGVADEATLIAPTLFPEFAQQLLGWQVNQNLAPYTHGVEGVPDYTPADAVTHPFVFDTKSTSAGVSLEGHSPQVTRYLNDGRPRIKQVILTNLVGIRVYALDDDNVVQVILAVNLVLLLGGTPDHVSESADAEYFTTFVDQFSYKVLSPEEKLARIRSAPPWNPAFEATNPEWLLQRLDGVVESLRSDVAQTIQAGALSDVTLIPHSRRRDIVRELRGLESRLGAPDELVGSRDYDDYLNAGPRGTAAMAMRQFESHTAVYTATRLLLVRAWEDTGLLDPSVLCDGGFDELLAVLHEVTAVVSHAFDQAGRRYPDLFSRDNAYSWYRPSEGAYIDAIYELANTYLGQLSSDILGQVYERELSRVDRKQLGQYYTPRDIIRAMWDAINPEALSSANEPGHQQLRVLDIATGSGGFLVEAARRLRLNIEQRMELGEQVNTQEWLATTTDGLVGVEIQQFSAYLAEVNLLLQLSTLLARDRGLRLPALRLYCADTLTLHDVDAGEFFPADVKVSEDSGLRAASEHERAGGLERVRDASRNGEFFDIACGNPPYIGEKSAAPRIAELRREHPYWDQFAASHQDYLYFFLILGVSKLRKGGRFAFITTEYWLKNTGARPLRAYLSQHCRIEKLVLFREMKLFADAPGQHSLVVVGERVTDPALPDAPSRGGGAKPTIAIYRGPTALLVPRREIVDSLFGRRSRGVSGLGTEVFKSQLDPRNLGGESWAEVVLTANQMKRRGALRSDEPVEIKLAEGIVAPPQALRERDTDLLPAITLNELGWPARRAGIFVLSAEEYEGLQDLAPRGALTTAEDGALRKVANTADVGGFNRPLQRPDERSCDGRAQAAPGRSGVSPADVVAWSTLGGTAGTSAAVLGGDRAWPGMRGRRYGGRRFADGRGALVPGEWRHAITPSDPAIGALPVVRRA